MHISALIELINAHCQGWPGFGASELKPGDNGDTLEQSAQRATALGAEQ